MKPLTLPYPPTTNNLFATVGRKRVVSPRYRAWRNEALWAITLAKPPRVTGPYALTIVATRPDRRARDLDNLAKPISDLLVSAGVVRDDSDAQSIRLSWSDAVPDKAAGVRVIVEAV